MIRAIVPIQLFEGIGRGREIPGRVPDRGAFLKRPSNGGVFQGVGRDNRQIDRTSLGCGKRLGELHGSLPAVLDVAYPATLVVLHDVFLAIPGLTMKIHQSESRLCADRLTQSRRAPSATDRPCDTNASTCRSLATISPGLCFF